MKGRRDGVVIESLEDVFGLEEPTEFGVAARLPDTCLCIDAMVVAVKLGDEGESGGGAEEIGIEEVGLAHGEPGVVEERVVLLLILEPDGFGVVSPAGLLRGLGLNGVKADGFGTLLDGEVERATGSRFVLVAGGDGV